MSKTIKCKVTDKAGERINGAPVKPGQTIELSEKQFNHFWLLGHVTTSAHEKSEAKAKAAPKVDKAPTVSRAKDDAGD
ncbi:MULTISPECIES: hypothetical protein [Cohaesibacter]|uniref:hypothetical protein n=1 Tax=Cohaesibacter TaxID=655352 RepID=UPI0010FED1E9|nr:MULTISPECIES: hypothetical protein [Cohaesibacter]TLP42675.1 hypothetical protein FDK21_19370 [Cohaesibacter sp. CAU 1516]